MDPWDILNTGSPFDIDAILRSPLTGSPLATGGGDILVGADADIDALVSSIATAGGGDILTGAEDAELAML